MGTGSQKVMKAQVWDPQGGSEKRLSGLGDEELMALYQKGNAEAFQELYLRYSDRIYGFLRSRLTDRALADDAHQATFLKLHRARDQYDPMLPFKPWLFTICRSSLFDLLRSRKIVVDQEIWDEAAVENAPAPVPEQGESDLPDLTVLTQEQQAALKLRYLEELSFDEISRRLDTSPTNVRQLVSRAVRKLKSIAKTASKESS